jgi:hypothetical protein
MKKLLGYFRALLGRRRAPSDVPALIRSLNFSAGEYCLVGGASLGLRGIRSNEGHDIDILITAKLYGELGLKRHPRDWRACGTKGGYSTEPTLLRYCGAGAWWPYSRTSRATIEAICVDSFRNSAPRIDDYIANAETVEGLPVISLADLVEWKTIAGRWKDDRDVTIVLLHLRANGRGELADAIGAAAALLHVSPELPLGYGVGGNGTSYAHTSGCSGVGGGGGGAGTP